MNITKQIFALASMIVVLAIITEVVIHGNETASVVKAISGAFANTLHNTLNS